MRVVAAIGGNALIERGETASIDVQRRHVADAAGALARVAVEHELVVTHGDGPQIGLLALQSESYADAPAYPLDVLGAQADGMIGYLVQQGLENALPAREVATLLTQIEVDPADPALRRPTKPIGPVYEEEEARKQAAERGWQIAQEAGGWRRVVPSPEPGAIVELTTIRLLLDAGAIVICAGGGGIPVVRSAGGGLSGVEAVIDKDLASARLALDLGADALLLLTDVAAVQRDFGTEHPAPIARATPAELRAMDLEPGSMGPKVEAACRFADGGGRACIAALPDAAAALLGEAGTTVLSP